MNDYVEDVATILADMKFCLEQMQQQTESGIEAMKNFRLPKLRMGRVTLKNVRHPMGSNIFHVIENGNVIGLMSFLESYETRTIQIRLDVLGTRLMSRVVRKDDLIAELIWMLDKFYLELNDEEKSKRSTER
jgi:hypothetical protein